MTRSHLAPASARSAADLCLDPVATAIAWQGPPAAPDGRNPPQRTLLHHLHVGLDRPAQGRRNRARRHLQLRAVAAELGMRPDDRVYQGMTIAFDFSVEEIWVPLAAGATLVPRPPGPSLVGRDWALSRRAPHHRPVLRADAARHHRRRSAGAAFLLVSGRGLPAGLVARWHRPGRSVPQRLWPDRGVGHGDVDRARPGEPVTIGVPLPNYAIVILDRDGGRRRAARRAVGEIGIAGICLAAGNVNREDLTDRRSSRTSST